MKKNNGKNLVVSLNAIKSQEDFDAFVQSFYKENPLKLNVILDWLHENGNKFMFNVFLGDKFQSKKECFQLLISADYFLDKLLLLMPKSHALFNDEKLFESVGNMLKKDNNNNYVYFINYMEKYFPENVNVWIEAIIRDSSNLSLLPSSIITDKKKSKTLLSNLFFSELFNGVLDIDESEDDGEGSEDEIDLDNMCVTLTSDDLSVEARENKEFMKIFDKFF